MSDGTLNDAATRALLMVERDSAFHDDKDQRILEMQRAYEGILVRTKPAAEWESKLHPPLVGHTIETAMTMLLDDDIKFEITPMPKEYEGTQWDQAVSSAQNNEVLFRRQMGQSGDRYNEFLRPFVLSAAINRVAIAKTHYRRVEGTEKYLAQKPMIPGLGRLSPTRLKESTRQTTFFDGPVTENVDLRDFYWPEAAVSLDSATYCAHAVWMSEMELREKAADGTYDQAAVNMLLPENENVLGGSAKTDVPQDNEIELDRERRGRKNGLYEVLEIWDKSTMTLHVLGARRVLLKQTDWPFWHRQFPFVAMSLAPFPFSIQGLSLVEKLAPLQDAYWDLLNQTMDNNRLINNVIILLGSDYDDPDQFEFAPGAKNTVDNPQQVKMWAPEYQMAQIAAPMLEKLQSDLQNLAMGQPLSIPMSGRVTATEIATLSQIAQNAAMKMKDQVTYAQERIGWQRMKLNGQYIRTPQHFVHKGKDGTRTPYTIPPHGFAGDFDFEMKPSPDSAVRTERRTEASGLMQLAVQAAAPLSMMGVHLNGKAFMDKVLDSYDIEDKDEFYSANPPAGLPTGPPQLPGGPGEGEGVGPGGQPVGVTGPNSINPAVSPSAQGSLAPGVMLARARASQGGTNNIDMGGAR